MLFAYWMTVMNQAAQKLIRKAQELVDRAAKIRAEVERTRQHTEQIMATARILVGENQLEARELAHRIPVSTSK